jgi:hypothetical protein
MAALLVESKERIAALQRELRNEVLAIIALKDEEAAEESKAKRARCCISSSSSSTCAV